MFQNNTKLAMQCSSYGKFLDFIDGNNEAIAFSGSDLFATYKNSACLWLHCGFAMCL